MGGNLSRFWCLVYLITTVRLIQVGNNRNDHFRYLLGVRVRLIEVSFQVNKGNKFGDFGYWPLNRGCPLNTGFTVSWVFYGVVISSMVSMDRSFIIVRGHVTQVITEFM